MKLIENGLLLRNDDSLGEFVSLCIDSTVYPLPIVMRALYWYTEQSYVFLKWDSTNRQNLILEFRKKENIEIDDKKLTVIAKEFCNSLIDQFVRSEVTRETKIINEIIVKKAFSEALSKDEIQVANKYGV